MKLAKVIESIPRESFTTFKNQDVSYNLLVKLSDIIDKTKDNPALQKYAMNAVETGIVDSSAELASAAETYNEVSANLPEGTLDREEIVADITNQKVKKEKEEKNKVDTDKDQTNRYLRDLVNYSKKLQNIMTQIERDNLNVEQLEMYEEQVKKLKSLLSY